MDKYEKIKVVGRGAFGTVFLCRRRSDDKEVIIKQIPVEQMNKEDRAATINEVKVLSMLHHPNVIEYLENFLQDQAMMIVMEYAAGGTLYDLLESKANEDLYLEEDEIAHLFAQIVLPTHLVHSRQILHRDLKTQNIFLTKKRDHVKIGDFGISKILSSKSKAYTVVGTPCYISPELCEGKPYNQKSDVWALGCILYEMCTLKRAFEAPTLPALVLKIMRGSFNPLPQHFSSSLRDFMGALLALDPKDRPDVESIMAHPWLAPHIYRLPTTLGMLPCTSKPDRPLSAVDFPEGSYFIKTGEVKSSKNRPSPFTRKGNQAVLTRINLETGEMKNLPFNLASFSWSSKTDEEVQGVAMRSHNRALATTTEGNVLEWTSSSGSPRHLGGLSGICITKIVCGGSNFVCLLTDRGILLTFGRGADGVLGHGDFKDLDKPRIVEALLGEEITHISCSENHIAAITSDNGVFGWGRNVGETLGGSAKESNSPIELRHVPEDVTFSNVFCNRGSTVLLTQDGEIHLALDPDKRGLAQMVCSDNELSEKSKKVFFRMSFYNEHVSNLCILSRKGTDTLLLHMKDGRVLKPEGEDKFNVIATDISLVTSNSRSMVMANAKGSLWHWNSAEGKVELPSPSETDVTMVGLDVSSDGYIITLWKAQ